MDITEHLRKFMAQQASLPIISVTPLLEQGLVAATGPGNTWAMTEAGHTLLETQDIEVEHSEHYWEKDRNGPRIPPYDYAAQQESLNAQARAALEADRTSDFLHKHVKPGALSEQIGGDHYKDFPIQPVEFIEKNGIRFLEGCIIKRMCRHEAKAGVEDLRKAIHEIRLIMELRYGVSE